MPIPIFTDLAAAQATILRRVPFDEVEVTPALLDGIEARVGERLTPSQVVERIVTDVRTNGDDALREWSRKPTAPNLRISPCRHAQQQSWSRRRRLPVSCATSALLPTSTMGNPLWPTECCN